MTMEKGKIFVGGLSWDTTKEALRSYFLQYGEVTDCIVMSNPQTGKSRGFGFVTFRDPSVVDVLLTTPKHTIDGRTVDAKACSARGSGGGAGAGAGGGGRQASGRTSGGYAGRTTKIFIGGLPNDANDDNLKDCFSRFGQVLEVVIMYDQEKSRPRGFGFLTLDSEDAVEAAVKEHYVDFNGKKIECKRAEPRQGGGGRGGKMAQGGGYNGYTSGEQTWGGMGDGANWNQYGYGQQPAYGGYPPQQNYDPNWTQQQAGYGQNYGQGWNQQSYGQPQQQNWGGPQPSSAGQGPGYGGYSGPGFSSSGGHQGYTGTGNYGGSNEEYGSGFPPSQPSQAGKPASAAAGYHPYKR